MLASTTVIYILKAIPILLTILWAAGAILFYFFRERDQRMPDNPPDLGAFPKVAIMIPCHNESKTIHATISSIDYLAYPNFEVIAIDDFSKDDTGAVIDSLAKTRPWMRTVHLNKNRGKAAALNVGLLSCSSDFIICIDADSELHPQAVHWLMSHLLKHPTMGAVTGNPRVKNRNNLIGRLQVGEFSATIGMIKRYQQMIGKLFTVSGVIVAYRKAAVLQVGFWDTESVTEDIAMSWRLQTSGWELGYEPRALCDVLMPGTITGLWRQRLRWAQGGFEVMSKYWRVLIGKGNWGLKILYTEYIFSVIWTFAFVLELLFYVFNFHLDMIQQESWGHALKWGIFVSGVIGFIQFLPGFSIHSRYEKRTAGLIFWAMWYPLIYWILNSAALLWGIPKSLIYKRQNFGTWTSPDRGGIAN